MKKIILILLLFFAAKQTGVAQVSSTLTQITTELMTAEFKSNFSWQGFTFHPLVAKAKSRTVAYIMHEPIDVGGGGGTSGTVPCECPPWIPPGPECENWKTYCKDNQTVGGTTTNNPDPNPFPGISIPPGPIPPLGSQIPPEPSFPSGGGGGGSASTPPADPTVPPPADPQNDPKGGTSTPPPPTDSAKLIAVDCDSFEIKKGIALTLVFDSVKNKQNVKDMYDNILNKKNEASVSVEKNNNNYDLYNYQSGASNNSSITTSVTGKVIVAGIHTHPIGKDGYSPGPSPTDFYHLINGYSGNNQFVTNYVLGADGNDWAISIEDPAKAALFLAAYPQNSTVNSTTNDWSNTATFVNRPNDKIYDKWLLLTALLNKKALYPLRFSQTFANVLLTNNVFSCGVGMYKKDANGKFHKIKIKITPPPAGSPPEVDTKVEVTICN